ncbi:hypothetical protein DRE_04805 [Drechslerella stenobrocha 248]|uniref:Uncharacterized protein n=1 Tax=Drechslerella stenobrocha 248 TaxID=1043628 RepID=W7I0L9_9PEZI|nr:hypothetical protein DRE_04805 [Drechslerella stenobrocha 248]
MISRILQDVPYDGIDPSWVRRVGAAVCVPRVDATTLAPIPSTYNLLSPSGVYLTVRTTGTTPSLVPNREWVKRHAQLLGEQLLADPRWAGLVEIMLFDDGLGTGVDGAVELRAALEAMLSKGWIVPLRTEGDSLSQALARQGDDGWVEHA